MLKKLIFGAIILATSGCTTLQQELKHYLNQPTVSYQSMSVDKIAIDAVALSPTFKVVNNNAFPIPINSANYNLSLNNSPVLSGAVNSVGTLAAKQSKAFTLPLVLTKESLLSFQHILLKEKQVDYQVAGSVNVMGISLPFQQSAVLYAPTLNVIDMVVKKASFTQLVIMLKVNISNVNQFSLPLNDIHYTVSSQRNILFSGNVNNQQIQTGQNIIELPLTIKPNKLFNNIFTLLDSPVLPLHFEINTPLFNQSYDQSLDLSPYFLSQQTLNTFNL